MAYSYLIETTEGLFLVDGGIAGTGRKILKRIAEIGRKPEDLLFAVLTHAHLDHFGGLAEVQEASGCAIICHPSHADTARRGDGIVSPGLNAIGRIYKHIADFILPKLKLPKLRNILTAEDGMRLHGLGLAGRLLHTPGHSTGDLTLVLDEGHAFVGDLVQGRRIARFTSPEFSIMATDETAMFASWRVLLESGAKVIYPGHGNIVTKDDIIPVFRRALARKARLGLRRSTATARSQN